MIDFAEDNLFVAMETFEDVSAALGDDFDSDCFIDYSLDHPQLVLTVHSNSFLDFSWV